jgi:hypothetical protein
MNITVSCDWGRARELQRETFAVATLRLKPRATRDAKPACAGS